MPRPHRPTVRLTVVGALLGGFALAALSTAGGAAAATPPAPGKVRLVASAHALRVSWSTPSRAAGASVVVTRTGYGADASTAGSVTLPAGTSSTTLPGLVPGAKYTVGVAFADATGTGPASTAGAQLPATGVPRLTGQTVQTGLADPPGWRSYDDGPCAIYHYNNDYCGYASVQMTTTGYTRTTREGHWTLDAQVTREFGCTDAAGIYTRQQTLVGRYATDGYGYWYYEPVQLDANGTSTNGMSHHFANPQGYPGGTDEMPHFVCVAGSTVTQVSATLRDAVAVLHAGPIDSGDPDTLLGVLYLPDSAA